MKDSQLKSSGYRTPVLHRRGAFQDITLGSSDGDFTDADFPVSTPKSELTFS